MQIIVLGSQMLSTSCFMELLRAKRINLKDQGHFSQKMLKFAISSSRRKIKNKKTILLQFQL
jgi:hypothetical protein